MPTTPQTHTQRLNRLYLRAPRRKTTPDRIRNSGRWKQFRTWFRKRNPLCCDPFGHHREDSRVEPTTDVHHIIGLREAPDLAYAEANCAPLCRLCHARIEGMERNGKRTGHLFESFVNKKVYRTDVEDIKVVNGKT